MENKFLKSISYSLAFREQDRKHIIENALKNHEKEKRKLLGKDVIKLKKAIKNSHVKDENDINKLYR